LIRLFRAENGVFLHELRRGSTSCFIYSICFDQSSSFIACNSDTGTTHIFSLKVVRDKLEILVKNEQAHDKKKVEIKKTEQEINNEELPKNPKSL